MWKCACLTVVKPYGIPFFIVQYGSKQKKLKQQKPNGNNGRNQALANQAFIFPKYRHECERWKEKKIALNSTKTKSNDFHT